MTEKIPKAEEIIPPKKKRKWKRRKKSWKKGKAALGDNRKRRVVVEQGFKILDYQNKGYYIPEITNIMGLSRGQVDHSIACAKHAIEEQTAKEEGDEDAQKRKIKRKLAMLQRESWLAIDKSKTGLTKTKELIRASGKDKSGEYIIGKEADKNNYSEQIKEVEELLASAKHMDVIQSCIKMEIEIDGLKAPKRKRVEFGEIKIQVIQPDPESIAGTLNNQLSTPIIKVENLNVRNNNSVQALIEAERGTESSSRQKD